MDGYEWVDQCPQGGTVKCCYTIVSCYQYLGWYGRVDANDGDECRALSSSALQKQSRTRMMIESTTTVDHLKREPEGRNIHYCSTYNPYTPNKISNYCTLHLLTHPQALQI